MRTSIPFRNLLCRLKNNNMQPEEKGAQPAGQVPRHFARLGSLRALKAGGGRKTAARSATSADSLDNESGKRYRYRWLPDGQSVRPGGPVPVSQAMPRDKQMRVGNRLEYRDRFGGRPPPRHPSRGGPRDPKALAGQRQAMQSGSPIGCAVKFTHRSGQAVRPGSTRHRE